MTNEEDKKPSKNLLKHTDGNIAGNFVDEAVGLSGEGLAKFVPGAAIGIVAGVPRNVKEVEEITEKELFELTENLLAKDENNCGKYFRLNLQGKRNGQKDNSEKPLFANVNSKFLQDVPTIKKLLDLQDNYVSVSSLLTISGFVLNEKFQ